MDALEDGIAFLLFLPTKVAFFVLTCRVITADVSLPFYSRPLRNAFKSAVNALITPSEPAYFLKLLASPHIRGVVVCELLRDFILQLVYQPIYVRVGALEHGLHTGSDSSQSALIISEVFISVLFLSLAGRFVSVGCRESWPFRPEARTSTSRAFR